MQDVAISPLLAQRLEQTNNNQIKYNKPFSGASQNDIAEFSNENNQKITFKEGAKLVLGGFCSKVKNMFIDIVKHPIKTVATAALTTGALMALPFIGIPTAVGAGALVIGFGGFAIFNTGREIYSAVKNSKNNDNNALRQDLKDIGGCAFDLAISTPFVPKAFKTVKNQFKYGKIGFNSELWNSLKSTKGLKNKCGAIKQANINLADDVNYRAGVDKLQKQLKFDDSIKQEYLDLRKYDGDEFIQKAYDRMTKDLGYGADAPELVIEKLESAGKLGNYDSCECKIRINSASEQSKSGIMDTMRHELQHYQQDVDMLRAYGKEGFYEKYIEKQFRKFVKEEGVKTSKAEKVADIIDDELKKTDTYKDIQKTIREKYNFDKAENVAIRQGKIAQNTKRYKQADVILEHTIDYNSYEPVDLPEPKAENFFKGFKAIFDDKKSFKKYANQFIEKEARKAGDIFKQNPTSTLHPIIESNIHTQELK